MSKTHSKALVIGSGFGGAIAAYRLAEAGIETLVLERGRRWTINQQQDTFCTYREPDGRAAWLSSETVLFDPKKIDVYTGILEKTVADGITVWSPCGVGGGSVVYNTVLLKPTEENFYKVFPKDVDYQELDKTYYQRVANIINPEQIAKDVLESDYYLSTRVFMAQGEEAELDTQLLNIGTSWDVVRKEIAGDKKPSAINGEIWYGINSGAKKSLDRNYLQMAENSHHVEVKPLHQVVSIAENPQGGFIVFVQRINEQGETQEQLEISCDYLFMGAGSMGTSKLLVKAKHEGTLPKLNDEVGKHWGNNGDTFATRDVGQRTNPGQGGPASAAIFDYQNPICPMTIIVYPEWDADEQTLTTLGMGIPGELGQFYYRPDDQTVQLSFPADNPANQAVLAAANHTYDRLDQANHNSSQCQNYQGHFACEVNQHSDEGSHANAGITAHPLGGCVMGKACDYHGRVKGYQGLYVTDGAFIPGSAAACNPAFTIAAFAERSMEQIIKDIQA